MHTFQQTLLFQMLATLCGLDWSLLHYLPPRTQHTYTAVDSGRYGYFGWGPVTTNGDLGVLPHPPNKTGEKC